MGLHKLIGGLIAGILVGTAQAGALNLTLGSSESTTFSNPRLSSRSSVGSVTLYDDYEVRSNLVGLSYETDDFYSTTLCDKQLLLSAEFGVHHWDTSNWGSDQQLQLSIVARMRLAPEVAIELGTGPSLLSDRHLGRRDMGGTFQFQSFLGSRWYLSPSWSVGLRVNHISNAGIYQPNPGVNTAQISIRRTLN